MYFGSSADESITGVANTGWSSDMESGIDELDREHRLYFDFVNDLLISATRPGYTRQGLIDTIDFLIRHAMEHFATEQKVMKQTGYDDYQQHCREHLYFLNTVGSLRKRVSSEGNHDSLMREVRFFALEWFVDHVRSSDMKFIEFLKKNREELTEPNLELQAGFS